MRRAAALVLVCALAARAQPALTPSPDVAAKLASIDERRDLVEALKQRAWNLKLSAGIGYGLFGAVGAWAVIELVLVSGGKPTSPLSGQGYAAPVAPWVLGLVAAVCGVTAIALHASSAALSTKASNQEADLDEEERPLRKEQEKDKDKDVPD